MYRQISKKLLKDIKGEYKNPVVYDVEFRNQLGKASTFIMNEIGMMGMYENAYSAAYR